jgi:hypothetical protein
MMIVVPPLDHALLMALFAQDIDITQFTEKRAELYRRYAAGEDLHALTAEAEAYVAKWKAARP